MIKDLISIAIFEKNPEQVLFWYDKCSDRHWQFRINHHEVADAIKPYAPERAVDIWKAKAEGLINQVKPKAYQDAVRYLRKAKKVMKGIKKQDIWDKYIKELRSTHARKKRLLEILDRMDKNPIVKIRR